MESTDRRQESEQIKYFTWRVKRIERQNNQVESRYPLFKHGRILKKEALEEIRDHSVDMLNIRYEGYIDGIISGLRLKADNEKKILTMGRGMVKFNGCVYLIKQTMDIPYTHSDQKELLRLSFRKISDEIDFESCEIRAELGTDESTGENELLICSFKLKSGFVLRDEYRSFADMGTEYDTINLIESQWAGYERPSFNMVVLRQYAREYLESKQSDTTDRAFCYMILNSTEGIDRNIIESYIAYKEDKGRAERLSNKDIYRRLSAIMKGAKPADKAMISGFNRRRILVD